MLDQLKNNGTFCVLPWIHDFTQLDGRKHLCCVASGRNNLSETGNIETASTPEIRAKIFNGEPVSNCDHCYKQEREGLQSYRQQQNRDWLNKQKYPDVVRYFENLTETTEPWIVHYDLRYDNKCNLACITCGPQFSTLWQKELHIPIKEIRLDINNEQLLSAKKIYLAGGEPLIIDRYIELLKFLAEHRSQAEILISTNLTTLPEEVLGYLKRLRSVIIVSTDTWGRAQEYVRYPLKWDKFIRNLEALKAAGINFCYNTTASALGVLGWERFSELEQYGPQDWWLLPTEVPPWHGVENLPAHAKESALQSIQTMTQTKLYAKSPVFKGQVDHLIERVQKTGVYEKKLLKEILAIDSRRGINHADYLGISLQPTVNSGPVNDAPDIV